MEVKKYKKIAVSLIIVLFILEFVLSGMIGTNKVEAAKLTLASSNSVYTYFEYNDITKYSNIKEPQKPDGFPNAVKIKTDTKYYIKYYYRGKLKIPEKSVDAYGKGKMIWQNGVLFKITSFEKGSTIKEGGVKKRECSIVMEGSLESEYTKNNLTPYAFGEVALYYTNDKAQPSLGKKILRTEWDISVKETKTVSGTTAGVLANIYDTAGSIAGLIAEITKVQSEVLQKETQVAQQSSQSGNNSQNNQTNTTQTSTGLSSTKTVIKKVDHSDMTDDARRLYIRNLYKRVLGREPSNDEITAHFNFNTDDEACNIIFSPESNKRNNINNMTNAQFIDACYKYLLGRTADEGGRNNWVKYLNGGKTRANAITSFTQSDEFKNLNKKSVATITLNAELCNACYINLRDKYSIIKPSSTTLKMYQEDLEKITELDLNGRGLTNLSGLSNFKKLKKLVLSNNKISDLSELTGLTNLEDLNISDNNITSLGKIKGLTKLKRLYANGNSIENISEISNLNNLTSISFTNCKVKKFTSDLSNLNSLEEIKIENNSLKDESLAKIATAKNLKRLHISKNQITSLDSLSGLSKMEEIYADNNMIKDVSKFGNIKKLLVRNNKISISTNTGDLDLPSVLVAIRNSQSNIYTNNIKFTNCKIENNKIAVDGDNVKASIEISGGNADKTVINITNNLRKIVVKDGVLAEKLKSVLNTGGYGRENGRYILVASGRTINNIKSLDLSTTDGEDKITDVTGLACFTNLSSLNLNNNQISNFEPLCGLEKLETLEVRFNDISNFTSLSKLVNLKQLDASNNRIVDLSGIENMKKLEHLLLSNNNIKNGLSPLNSLKDSLTILTLNNNKISDVSGLSQLKLNALYLAYNEIADISPINTVNLDNFDIENNSITINTSEKEVDLPSMIKSDLSLNGGSSNLECSGCKIESNKIVLDEGTRVANVKVLNGKFKDSIITVQDLNALNSPNLTVSYELRNNNTEMMVTINSDKEIQTVLGWDRINNSTGLRKIYNYNVSNEIIVVTDMYGNETEQLIQFTGVVNNRIPDLTVSYSGKMRTNENVTVTVSSSEKLYRTQGWTLSEDGKSISKEYTENTNHTYTTIPILTEAMFDVQMQPINLEVELAIIDKQSPNLTVEYSQISSTKGSVRATVWSDEEIAVFSQGRYTKVQKLDDNGNKVYGLEFYFSDNASEDVIIRDLSYNTTNVNLTVNNIDKGVDGLYAKTNTSNLTKDNVTLIVGANETIYLNTNNQAKTREQRAIIAKTNKLANNIKGIINDKYSMYLVADNTAGEHSYTKILLAEANDRNSDIQSGDRIEIDLSENELGVIAATDSTNNTDLVLFNSCMIDKDEVGIYKETTRNDDGSVTVKLYSNKVIANADDLAKWNLSEDGMVLSQTFTKNHEEMVHIVDMAGNEVDCQIIVDEFINIDYTVYYYYIEGTDDVYVFISSSVPLEQLDGWEISEDGKTLGKKISIYDPEQIITIYDTEGNSQEITIQYNYQDNLDVNKTDDTQANLVIPNTGKQIILRIAIAVIIAITVLAALRRRKRTLTTNKIKKN